MRKAIIIILTGLSLVLFSTLGMAKGEKKAAGGPPPMLVAVAEVISGKMAPTADFVGTIYFTRTAQVAAEVDGIVRQLYSADGQRVKAGSRLIRLDDDLLATEIAGVKALNEQNQVDLVQAQKDYARIAALHQQDSVSTSEYEAYETRVKRTQKQAAVLQSRLDRMLLEQKKKSVRAPFAGKIIELLVERGEWVKAGGTVATLADDRTLEARVDIPARLIPHLTTDYEATISVAGKEVPGKFIIIIPRGDISTRTFIAKFSLPGDATLIEGMQADVSLPTASAREGLLVPRDAVINSYGKTVVFTISEGVARMIPVKIIGHSGAMTGISSDDLSAGQQVVVKGNERIRDGQPVRTE
jgi:RND family efflux transporter MFP subunit